MFNQNQTECILIVHWLYNDFWQKATNLRQEYLAQFSTQASKKHQISDCLLRISKVNKQTLMQRDKQTKNYGKKRQTNKQPMIHRDKQTNKQSLVEWKRVCPSEKLYYAQVSDKQSRPARKVNNSDPTYSSLLPNSAQWGSFARVISPWTRLPHRRKRKCQEERRVNSWNWELARGWTPCPSQAGSWEDEDGKSGSCCEMWQPQPTST